MPVEQGHPAAAVAHQEVGGGGAQAARADHDDVRIRDHPTLLRHVRRATQRATIPADSRIRSVGARM